MKDMKRVEREEAIDEVIINRMSHEATECVLITWALCKAKLDCIDSICGDSLGTIVDGVYHFRFVCHTHDLLQCAAGSDTVTAAPSPCDPLL